MHTQPVLGARSISSAGYTHSTRGGEQQAHRVQRGALVKAERGPVLLRHTLHLYEALQRLLHGGRGDARLFRGHVLRVGRLAAARNDLIDAHRGEGLFVGRQVDVFQVVREREVQDRACHLRAATMSDMRGAVAHRCTVRGAADCRLTAPARTRRSARPR